VATKEINVAALLAKIDFSPDNVVHAASVNSSLFVEAITYRLSCLEQKSAAKMAWEKGRAEKELKIRQTAREDGTKITEGNIDAMLLVDPGVSALTEKLSRKEVLDAYSQLVVEAFRMRRDCLRIVEGMTRDEYSMGRVAEAASEKTREIRNKMKDKFPGE
jgi:hypothetical protein